MVSELNSGLRGSGSRPGLIFARHFTLTVPISTQEYKWVPSTNCQGNLTKGRDSLQYSYSLQAIRKPG